MRTPPPTLPQPPERWLVESERLVVENPVARFPWQRPWPHLAWTLLWNVIHQCVAHPMLLTRSQWSVRFHDWTAEVSGEGRLLRDEFVTTMKPFDGGDR